MELFIGIFGSVIASAIVYAFVKWNIPFLSKRLSGSIAFGHGVEYVYKNQANATKDILKDAKSSSEICIFTIRGYSYFQPERDLHVLTEGEDKRVKFLIAAPCTNSEISNWIMLRANEYKNTTPEKYKKELISGIETIKIIMSKRPNIECKIHDEPPVFRMILLSNRIYISFFLPYKSGSQLPVYRIKASSDIYKGFKRYFDFLWNEADDCKSVNC